MTDDELRRLSEAADLPIEVGEDSDYPTQRARLNGRYLAAAANAVPGLLDRLAAMRDGIQSISDDGRRYDTVSPGVAEKIAKLIAADDQLAGGK